MKAGYIMRLHEDKNAFEELITATAEYMTIPQEQVEKDYYVSYLLEHLVREVPSLVFKGGTSLSKCYGVIKRFSEDIDINYAVNKKPSDAEKRHFKKGIIRAINNAGLTLENEDEILSRRDHNSYEVIFPNIVEFSEGIKKQLLIETYIAIKTFPSERKMVSSYIFDYLKDEQEKLIIERFNLQPFEINVQRIDRTVIDKIFAICDYHELQKFNRNSRHLYDIHKIFKNESFNKEEFLSLFELVRKERELKDKINLSSVKGYNLIHTLSIVLDKDIFEDDYNNITEALLFEEVSYKEVKDSLYDLLQQGMIP